MYRYLLWSAVAAGAILIPGGVSAQSLPDVPQYDWNRHMMWWGGNGYAMIFAPLLMIVFLAVFVAVVILLLRWLGGPWQHVPPQHAPYARSPLDILKERFARGEIDKEEFEERRRVLGE